MQSAVGGKVRAHTMVGQGKTREYGGGLRAPNPGHVDFQFFKGIGMHNLEERKWFCV